MLDLNLRAPGSTLTVVANTAQAALAPGTYEGSHPVGSTVTVRRKPHRGAAFVEIREVGPAEALVLVNSP